MPLQRLTPMIMQYDLGTLRLWQDDLAAIVRLVSQLPGTQVRIESEHYQLSDVQNDLTEIGHRLGSQRLSYFVVTATRPGSGDAAGQEIISVKLATNKCFIEATEPDLATIGLIDGIREITRRRRRRGLVYAACTALIAIPLTVIAYLLYFGTHTRGGFSALGREKDLPGGLPGPVVAVILILSVTTAVCFFFSRMTFLNVNTQQEAPTFWQRKRADILIAAFIGALFYVLGLLTAHL